MAADSVVLWTPTEERVAACQLTAFRIALAEKHGLDLPDYAALHAWSVAEREEFWREVWALGDVIGDGSLDRALVNDVMPGASWFPDTSLNYAENCLRRRDDAVPAIISSVEGTNRRELTWGQLYSQVAQLSALLRDHGVGPGVRCAAYTPNVPEAVVAMLAVTSLGGVWSSCSPDFGASAVLDRLGQVEPKVLFVCDAYTYKGKSFDRLAEVAGVLDGLSCVEHCIILSPGASAASAASLASTASCSVELLDDLLQPQPESAAQEIPFERVAFDAPLYIMFSSGTTGVPKAMIHSVGGTLLQHIKEHRLHTDLRADDRYATIQPFIFCFVFTLTWG